MGEKRILITGSNGLLGQKIIHNLRKRAGEFAILATSKGDNRITETMGYTYQSMDITNQAEVLETFRNFQPDVVINTAAMTNVDACETHKEACRSINVKAVEYLIEASKLHDAHLIHLSTDFVFDGADGPYQEDDQPAPLSFYGQSKYDAELLVQESGLDKWSIVRTIIVYGVAEAMSRSNIVLWAREALRSGGSLNIVNDQFRSPTLAEDLAEGCILIAEKEANGLFHISGKDFMSIIELVKRVAKHYGLDTSNINETSSLNLNQAAKRPPKTGFILDKAEKVLGYRPHSFEEGLALIDQQLVEST